MTQNQIELLEQQIALEKKMTQRSIDEYRRELEQAKQKDNFGVTPVSTQLLSRILESYERAIKDYLKEYSKGKAVRSTTAAEVIQRLDVGTVAYISAKTVLNMIYSNIQVQHIYKAIGQGLEDELKMRECREENSHYYKTIQQDLNKRGTNPRRKKNITAGVFNKRLGFHLDRWTITEKFQAGLVLTNLFIEATELVEYEDVYRGKKHLKYLIPTPELVEWIENTNNKLEVMQPFFLPMVCKPKDWTGIFEGGYISPYLKRNKFIKNNDRDYLKKLSTATMPYVYEAVNHLQSTAWQINTEVLDVVKGLWEIGCKVAELPDREDEALIPYPYPDKEKEDSYTDEEKEIVKKWKRETYETHKRNIQKRSLRISAATIIRIANDFKEYEKIYFPHQMDFRGRLYPIPVLLQPQGSDLAKGLLRFAEGKKVGETNIKWLQIHGANVYGYDKESYDKRVEWVLERQDEIKAIAHNPMDNRNWANADKPFQFLAFCFEYSRYLDNPDDFITHIPVQLDGTCNGLQHYSALLRDKKGGKAVNLINSDKPNDIYSTVAEKLEEKLKGIIKDDGRIVRICRQDSSLDVPICSNYSYDRNVAGTWLSFGINRKLTKRPVMVLPYGGTIMSCREYITEYLKDNYSSQFLWEHFKVGDNPTDCMFKVSVWLSKHLWEAITETLESAIIGMDYLRKLARVLISEKKYLEWLTPMGLLVRQNYPNRKKKTLKTELFGSVLYVNFNVDQQDTLDNQRQVNGICPNFIHSLDASCLMLYLIKCMDEGINSFMTVHDSYGTLAPDTETSARLLREAFVEIYRTSILENFTEDVLSILGEDYIGELPEIPQRGDLDIEEVINSKYFFN